MRSMALPNRESFAKGTAVRIGAMKLLEDFRRPKWRFHHPLSEEQIEFAGRSAVVKAVSFYHGGDVLYELVDVPGIWHEACLESI